VPFRFTFSVDNEAAMTVPYAPIVDEIRTNRGFVDLRAEPDRARTIAEGSGSDALRALLVRVADPHAGVFTLGCDLGRHTESTSVPRHRREVAGGYVQIASIDYHRTPSATYAAFARALVDGLRTRCGRDSWNIEFIGKWVSFEFVGEQNGIYPTLWIWFFAAAADRAGAFESRERLITTLSDMFMDPSVLSTFAVTP
jgi:hypothetical protein